MTFVNANMLLVAKKTQFDLERFFQALGDKTRLRLLNLMGDQELCVCHFVEVLDCPQPKISRHLAYLRRAGIVSTRRDGKWMHYRIAMPPHAGAAQILRETLAVLKAEKLMQADKVRLTKVCCSPNPIPALDGAPMPSLVQINDREPNSQPRPFRDTLL
jgi:ArsR family transcriptional regulator